MNLVVVIFFVGLGLLYFTNPIHGWSNVGETDSLILGFLCLALARQAMIHEDVEEVRRELARRPARDRV